jgi:uncharacterized cupredoxin-like copper-binding protein
MLRPLLLAFALLLVAACGGEEAVDDAAPAGDGSVVEIALGEFALEPSAIALEPGAYTLHVVNEGGAVHALEVDGPSGEVETGNLDPGESAELEVDLSESGEYELYCPVGDHRDRGMERAITVGGGGVGTTTDETTTEEDSDYRY